MQLLFPGREEDFREVARLLVDAPSVAVVTHIKPDADAVGSACALTAGLRQLGISATAYIGQDFPHPENLDTVPFVDEIVYTHNAPEGPSWSPSTAPRRTARARSGRWSSPIADGWW